MKKLLQKKSKLFRAKQGLGAPNYLELPKLPKEKGPLYMALGLSFIINLLFLNYFQINSLSNIFFESQHTPIELELVEEEAQFQFVETNPHALEKKPRTDRIISNRSQQAAEANPDPKSDSFLPEHASESPSAHKIVPGSFFEKASDFPSTERGNSTNNQQATSAAQTMPQTVQTASPPEQSPVFLDKEIDPMNFTKEGVRIPKVKNDTIEEFDKLEKPEDTQSVEKFLKNPKRSIQPQSEKPIQEYIVEDDVLIWAQEQPVATTGGAVPRPRKKLQFSSVPGPIKKSFKKASELGVVSVEASFSQFGDYLQRMLESISSQWALLAQQAQYSVGAWGSRVQLSFNINKNGTVSTVTIDFSSANPLGTIICSDAVQSRAPYGEWTPEMIELLGDKQRIHIGFSYR